MVSRVSLAAFLFTPLLLVTAAGFAACSSSSGTGASSDPPTDAGVADAATCPTYNPPSSFNPTNPTVSFSTGVFPIFQASCAFASCHGSTTAPQGGLFLGSDPALVYASLVGVAASDYPTMDRVKAGDPTNSYLLYRLDGNACSLPGCTTVACYELMPQGNPMPIAEATRLTIRGWIAQGALNDLPDGGPSLDGSVDAAPEAAAASDAGDAGAASDADDAGDGASQDASDQ